MGIFTKYWQEMSETKVITVEWEITKRKYEVDIKGLQNCLKAHRKDISYIAESLELPKTLVEHWFRRDKYFTVPDADVWYKLKDLLGITTNEFDESITTLYTDGGTYDMRNRIYLGDVSPTLTANSKNYYYLLGEKNGREKRNNTL